MEYDTSEIIDSNGTKFRVGWDEFGWFSIERGEMHEGEFYPDDSPITSFPPHKTDELIEIIEQR